MAAAAAIKAQPRETAAFAAVVDGSGLRMRWRFRVGASLARTAVNDLQERMPHVKATIAISTRLDENSIPKPGC